MWLRRPSLPDDVRVSLGLTRADRVLSAAALDDGRWAVATNAGLLVSAPAAGGDGVVRRQWSDVDRAAYDPAHGAVTVRWVDAAPALRMRLADPRRTRLARVIRERVEWSVVLSEQVPLPDGRAASVAVRRTVDGDLFSQVIAEPGADLRDPQIARVLGDAERRVRSAAGL
ncbi:hypothetical protein [Xylanimonas ulmi]|uniref:Uncharacterized protein n=1 Tax=Xylanimonas ulmi TaxID=228973 RepID=A0A4Q7LZD0_9MICO|nr:hypothetical protein [Xylanibacterium ulmi]RZS60314.1 hypothetical protein EV386_0567 [Xylanibacterium ulmi]